MSTIYLATDPLALAEELAGHMDGQLRGGDAFETIQVVVPNRYLGKWLRLWLASKRGIAINLKVSYLEQAIWEMLRDVDPRQHDIEPELLDADSYRLLVLAALLGEDDPELAPLTRYIDHEKLGLSRSACRRAWGLADRLSGLIRDYEYHRQETLIQPWISHLIGKAQHPKELSEYERSQRAIFQRIVRSPGGKRDLLNLATAGNRKTLPQYAMEVAMLPNLHTQQVSRNAVWHLFGITQMSTLHTHTLRWLGEFFDFRLYHLNPLVSALGKSATQKAIESIVRTICTPDENAKERSGVQLLRAWGHAGAESFRLLLDLIGARKRIRGPAFKAKILTDGSSLNSVQTKNVLRRLHRHLLGDTDPSERAGQDESLQIIGCPGRLREVETVYQSILHNLANDSKLKQTDIAVLVTDMGVYRPLLQSIFERPPRRLSYNLADYSAAGLSVYGQAMVGMLDLALESFSRSRVFGVLLNPCFLARLGVDRDQTSVWLRWAEELGVFQGWDADEKAERGQPASEVFGWKLALQRLRLGRYMEVVPDEADRPATRFGNVIPFADLESGDRELLDGFSRAVEGLLPRLARLRRHMGTGQSWAMLLRQLAEEYLDIPADRPEEAQVRDQLFAGLEKLRVWDALQPHTPDPPSHGGESGLPLALVREFVHSGLETLEGSRGTYLTGGVTISALQPMRPVPFRIIYILGLGEDLFPGSDSLSTLDLRGLGHRQPGDIRAAENARFLFLETLLSAKDKLYLLFNDRDVQRDQKLLAAVPVLQLKRFLGDHVVGGEFTITEAPLHLHDPERLHPPLTHEDALAHYDDFERLLALDLAVHKGQIQCEPSLGLQLAEKRKQYTCDFRVASDRASRTRIPAVSLSELRRFLENPAKASLQRHLHLRDEESDDELQDDEPFVSPSLIANRFKRLVVERIFRQAMELPIEEALAAWPEYFARLYGDWQLRSRVPTGAFGDADRASLRTDLAAIIDPGLAEFLRARSPEGFCGPMLVGESLTPLKSRRRFPALKVKLPHPVQGLSAVEARLSGATSMAWFDKANFDILVLSYKNKFEERLLSSELFEPVLLYLTLLAHTDAGLDGMSPRDWLEGRKCRVHVCHTRGISAFAYHPEDISSEAALFYLSKLAADFLDPTVFDLLPFHVISKSEELQEAYMASEQNVSNKSDYLEELEEGIERSREDTFRDFNQSDVVDLSGASVPPDAYAKVRRRFRFFDIGPARIRAAKASATD